MGATAGTAELLFITSKPIKPPMRISILLLVVSLSEAAFAQSSARFTIVRSVIAGGGATFSTNTTYRLGGTMGQSAAGSPSGSRFSIQSGFWIWDAPMIFAPLKVGTNFIFSFETELGKTYTVEYTDSLTSPNWQSLPDVAGNGSVKTVTNSVASVAERFYRVREH